MCYLIGYAYLIFCPDFYKCHSLSSPARTKGGPETEKIFLNYLPTTERRGKVSCQLFQDSFLEFSKNVHSPQLSRAAGKTVCQIFRHTWGTLLLAPGLGQGPNTGEWVLLCLLCFTLTHSCPQALGTMSCPSWPDSTMEMRLISKGNVTVCYITKQPLQTFLFCCSFLFHVIDHKEKGSIGRHEK